jgi:hypothetical protein
MLWASPAESYLVFPNSFASRHASTLLLPISRKKEEEKKKVVKDMERKLWPAAVDQDKITNPPMSMLAAVCV